MGEGDIQFAKHVDLAEHRLQCSGRDLLAKLGD